MKLWRELAARPQRGCTQPAAVAVRLDLCMAPITFAEATAVRPVGEGRFEADVHPDWTIGGNPNGGYLLAVLARAAAMTGTHVHPLASSAHFLRAPQPGPAQLTVTVLRAGRTASQVRAGLAQDGTACVEAIFTLGVLEHGGQPYWSAGVPQLPAGDRDSAIRVPGVNPAGLPVPIMDQVDLRLDRDTMGFGRGAPSGRGELRGWLALLDGAGFDPISLLYALDAFPPATFDVELTGWVPTLELTAYVRALPAPGPLRVVQRAHLIDAQRVDESCWVWDSAGRVVAQAVQLAGIRLG